MFRVGFASLFVFDFSHKKFDSTGEGRKMTLCNFIPLFLINMSVKSLEILHNDTKYPRFMKKKFDKKERGGGRFFSLHRNKLRADYQNLTPLLLRF